MNPRAKRLTPLRERALERREVERLASIDDRLNVAAPALLMVCRRALEALESQISIPGTQLRALIADMHIAIAKADGTLLTEK